MPDSHHYHSVTYTDYHTDYQPHKLLNEIKTFLGTTVGNGWSVLYYTGKNQGKSDIEFGDYEYQTFVDPVGTAFSSGQTGVHAVIGPTNVATSQSLYLRWDDGNEESWESTFCISNQGVGSNPGVNASQMRVAYLSKPFVEPVENPTGVWGTNYTWNGDLGQWTGTPPSGDPLDYGYLFFPATGTSDAPSPRTHGNFTVTSLYTQPGYINYALANELTYGGFQTVGISEAITFHLFGGVENGAPYFYCVAESGEKDAAQSFRKYYGHFGIGKISKIGNWRGGQYAIGTYWGGLERDNPWADDHDGLMDADWDNDYATSKVSRIGFRNHQGVYDKDDPATVIQDYTFGNDGQTYWAKGSLVNDGLIEDAYTDGLLSEWRGNPISMPNYVYLNDVDSNFHFLVGTTPCMRGGHMTYVQEGHEFTENGRTWKVFPIKSRYDLGGSHAESNNLGIMFRKS